EYKFDEVQETLNQKRIAFITTLRERPSTTKETPKKRGRKSKKNDGPSTVDITLEYFRAGMSVADIARERGLVPSTIEQHLAKAVSVGAIDIFNWITAEEMVDISTIVATMPEGFGSTDLYKAVKGKYSYAKLRAAVEYIRGVEGVNESESERDSGSEWESEEVRS